MINLIFLHVFSLINLLAQLLFGPTFTNIVLPSQFVLLSTKKQVLTHCIGILVKTY